MNKENIIKEQSKKITELLKKVELSQSEIEDLKDELYNNYRLKKSINQLGNKHNLARSLSSFSLLFGMATISFLLGLRFVRNDLGNPTISLVLVMIVPAFVTMLYMLINFFLEKLIGQILDLKKKQNEIRSIDKSVVRKNSKVSIK